MTPHKAASEESQANPSVTSKPLTPGEFTNYMHFLQVSSGGNAHELSMSLNMSTASGRATLNNAFESIATFPGVQHDPDSYTIRQVAELLTTNATSALEREISQIPRLGPHAMPPQECEGWLTILAKCKGEAGAVYAMMLKGGQECPEGLEVDENTKGVRQVIACFDQAKDMAQKLGGMSREQTVELLKAVTEFTKLANIVEQRRAELRGTETSKRSAQSWGEEGRPTKRQS